MISGIVLAAGTSSRLGRPKQLLKLGGKIVLQHVVDAAVRSGIDEVVVVLGHAADEISGALSPHRRVRLVVNDRYALGQSTSLREGLAAVHPAAVAAVVLLGDQPGVRTDAISAVVESWRVANATVVEASYGGLPAHPMVFARSAWPELAGAEGDEGARNVLRHHPEWVRLVEVGGTPPDDIDTEQDYERLRMAQRD